MIWKPSSLFLRQGRLNSPIAIDGMNFDPKWEFFKLPRKSSMGATISCRLTCGEIEAFGYGDHFLWKNACIIALAEAWERFWFLRASRGQCGPNINGFEPTTTNGFAAAKTDKEALVKSRLELLERIFMIRAWENMSGWEPFRPTSVKNKCLLLMLNVQLGWQIRTFTIQAEECPEIVIAGFGFHPSQGLIFDSVGVPSNTQVGRGFNHLMLNLMRSAAIQDRDGANQNFELPEDGDPISHAKFYTQSKNAQAVWSLLDGFGGGRIKLENYGQISSALLASADQLPAVAVSFNPHWPQMQWGRQTIKGKNPWPHPLA